MNAAKILSLYDPATGKAPDDGHTHFRKPLFLAASYFMGKLFILPFVGWPDWPAHLFAKLFLLITLGGIGGILEYSALMYLPVTIVAMLRVAGLVAFTAVGSAFITRRSTLNSKMGLALVVVVAGAALASYSHASDADGLIVSAVLGLGVVMLSTLSDACEQLVAEIILHEQEVDVDVLKFSAVSGVFGCGLMGVLMGIAQVLPGDDHGCIENSVDTFHHIFTSWMCVSLFVVILISVVIDMIGATFLTKFFGATTKESVLSFRIVGAWVIAVMIFLIMPSSGFGEEWDSATALAKTIGGVIIIAGVFMYVQWRREHEEEVGKVPAYASVGGKDSE